jgi:hypothetical protein
MTDDINDAVIVKDQLKKIVPDLPAIWPLTAAFSPIKDFSRFHFQR